ncbi:formimidoylglutamase [Streptococcus sp. zg-86]|uniref:Formimidoylglutamase n=1 Tax=Streptococcus zhangguiae TaxID=2664091 RepID=A0A6I4RUP0_9STRE|nr:MULTISPECIES: arginase family protein [unclassified Streptococcus]MTB64953.1 formimidoylglutamase [Streptococcus sp. zg-86]MTB91167.1 formimidoylglutamase [Streptococcus sp. zg-36]MWV56962.1 formimidoylglutamase [Streptococcus sp. zg-70]QTH48752.1 arginase family protein [Streptococcus sp. zg-86]
MLEDYYKLVYPYYQGAVEDDLYAAKWGMRIQFLDLNDEALSPFEGINFGIIGFKSDKGVYINHGRVGAVEGPEAIRPQLAKLPWHLGRHVRVFDVGNIDGPNRSLSQLQHSLAKAVKRMRELNIRPIVLGGGHGTAYGHYTGLKNSLPTNESLAVINFDAHFDLRPYDQTGPNSGTGFRQMFDDAQEEKRAFPYLVLGIQEHNNNLFLFDFVAKSEGIEFLTGLDMYKMGHENICQLVDRFLADKEKVYVTIDMDCFSFGVAPGVSAIQSLGVDPNVALIVLQHIVASGKLVGFDVVEVSPPHDIDFHTANLAATFIFYMTQIWSQIHHI